MNPPRAGFLFEEFSITCIAGLLHEGKVYIGGDSAGVRGWELTVRADRKVFRNGDFLMGFTSSFRMGQLLQYAFVPPKRFPDKDVMNYLVVDFVDALRACLKTGGFAKKESETESAGEFLLGYAGRLFTVHSDYQLSESTNAYAACGCGESHALGALFANKSLPPIERINQALAAAEAHSAGVRGPFHVETM